MDLKIENCTHTEARIIRAVTGKMIGVIPFWSMNGVGTVRLQDGTYVLTIVRPLTYEDLTGLIYWVEREERKVREFGAFERSNRPTALYRIRRIFRKMVLTLS